MYHTIEEPYISYRLNASLFHKYFRPIVMFDDSLYSCQWQTFVRKGLPSIHYRWTRWKGEETHQAAKNNGQRRQSSCLIFSRLPLHYPERRELTYVSRQVRKKANKTSSGLTKIPSWTTLSIFSLSVFSSVFLIKFREWNFYEENILKQYHNKRISNIKSWTWA